MGGSLQPVYYHRGRPCVVYWTGHGQGALVHYVDGKPGFTDASKFSDEFTHDQYYEARVSGKLHPAPGLRKAA